MTYVDVDPASRFMQKGALLFSLTLSAVEREPRPSAKMSNELIAYVHISTNNGL